MPMVIVRQRLPVTGQFTLLVSRVRRRVQHQVKCRRHFLQPPQYPSEQRRQLPAVRSRPWLLEQMIVPPVQQPSFVRYPRSIRTQRVVIPLHVHDAFSLLLFLTHRIAENAALLVLEPFVRGVQFVLDAPRNKNRRGHL